MGTISVHNGSTGRIDVSVTSNSNSGGSALYYSINVGATETWNRDGMETVFISNGLAVKTYAASPGSRVDYP
jgi:hypothetical protein